MKRHHWYLLAAGAIFPLLALIEWAFGRSPLGPDGQFGLWTANIWGAACSQRIADPYAFSHIIHGMAFYGLLWLFARRLPLSARYLIAVLLEAGWELLENSSKTPPSSSTATAKPPWPSATPATAS